LQLQFYKYQGAGNDFVIINNNAGNIQLSSAQIAFLCNRRFGIGADGLMLLETTPDADFRMIYYNADGNESTMCGNGGRCIASFALHQNIAAKKMKFTAIDGIHEAEIHDDKSVSLQMTNIDKIEYYDDHFELNTGSPHYVQFVTDVADADIVKAGRRIRNFNRFAPKGINVNFVERFDTFLKIRTYERGVEDETLACGTGVTAAAIASVGNQLGIFDIEVHALGGVLHVHFEKISEQKAIHVILKGPAEFVYEGTISIS